MRTRLPSGRALPGSGRLRRPALILTISVALLTLLSTASFAQQAAPVSHEMSGEASLKLPDLSTVSFLGMDGHSLLLIGILFCIFGLLFALVQYMQLKNLAVHRAMREMSELIYEGLRCSTVAGNQHALLNFEFWVLPQ